MTVTQVNDAATFSGDISGSGSEDALTPITGTLTVSDTADGMTAPNFTVTGAAGNGTATINAGTGEWSYTPAGNFNGSDSFTVSVTDDDGNVETKVINLTVTQVNDAATFSGDISGSGSEDALTPITGTLSVSDTADGMAAPNFTVTGAAGNGTATIDAGTGEWSYTPAGNFNGSDSFTVSVTDDDGNVETKVINLTVTQVNDAATFSGDISGSGSEDALTPITGTLSVSDTIDGMAAPNFTVTGAAGNGTATIDAGTGEWSYTPAGNFNGSDSFTVSVTDDDGNVETKVISLTVTQVNDAATFSGDISGSGSEDALTPITGTLSVSDTADGMAAPNFTVTGAAGNGTATIDAGTGEWSYTPAGNFNGSDSFTVSVTDDDGNVETKVINLTVTQVNDAATFSGDISGSGSEDALTPITGTLSVSDTIDGMAAPNFTVTGAAGNGTATIDAGTGEWSYTPAGNFNGSDSFTVSVTDDDGNVETKVISLTVTQVNDAATFSGDISGSGSEDALTPITGTLSVSDTADGMAAPNFTVTGAAGNGTATINAGTGEWSYTPAGNFNGSDSFTVSVTDDDGNVETKVISLTVNSVNDAPVNSVPGEQTTAVNTDIVFSGGNLISVSDVDAGSELETVTLSVSHGTLTLSPGAGLIPTLDVPGIMILEGTIGQLNTALNGLTYHPTSGFQGSDALTITISDHGNSGGGGSKADGNSIAITVGSTDTIAPETQITVHPASLTNSTDANFTWIGTDNVGGSGVNHFVYSLDGAPGVLNSSGTLSLTSVAQGTHTLSAFAVDGAGNADLTPDSFTWTVDTTAPTMPANGSNSVSESVTASDLVYNEDATDAHGPVTYTLSGTDFNLFTIDSNGDVKFIAAPNFETPSDNSHDNVYDFVINATDAAGNTATENVAITVTNVAPTTPTDSNGTTNTVVEGAAVNSLVGLTASSTDIHGGTVTYSMTNDTSGGGFKINASTGEVSVANGALISFAGSGASHTYSVTVQASDGTLTSSQSFTIGVTASGGGLNLVGDGNANSLAGGIGNDTLTGNGGNDSLVGGTGNDTYIFNNSGDGTDRINDAGGTDRIQINTTGPMTQLNFESLDLGLGAPGTGPNDLQILYNGGTINVIDHYNNSSTDPNGSLPGTGAIETINFGATSYLGYAISGDYTINADRLSPIGGPTGASTNDILASDSGNETINAGAGNDMLFGNGGNDVLNGGDGNDLLIGGAGTDTLNGGNNNDWLIGGTGNDNMQGGSGDDTFIYTVGDGADTINGGTGTDVLSLIGSTGNDSLTVTVSGNLVTGVAGGTVSNIDQVFLDFLGGNDTLSYGSTSQNVTVNLSTGTATGFSSIAGVENITGGSGNDILTGDSNANTLNGGSGNDTLVGGAGADNLLGGSGNDVIFMETNDSLIDGGSNSSNNLLTASNRGDVMVLSGAVDFTTLGDIFQNIETISMRNADGSTGNSALTLNVADVKGMADTGVADPTASGYSSQAALRIDGDSADSVTLQPTGPNDHWVAGANSGNGIPAGYSLYVHVTSGTNRPSTKTLMC